MSSTKRGAKRVEADFYRTPEKAFKPLIPYLPKGQIWEPAMGDGRLVKWMLEAGLDAWGSDINEKENPIDFLMDVTERFCVVTNPPFSIAWEFCRHAVQYSEHVFLLLRLGFLASQTRCIWFRNHEPSALFVLSERPSFAVSVACKKGKCYQRMFEHEEPKPKQCPNCGGPVRFTKSDSADYAWFYWGRNPLFRGITHLL